LKSIAFNLTAEHRVGRRRKLFPVKGGKGTGRARLAGGLDAGGPLGTVGLRTSQDSANGKTQHRDE
jgi:hypothetical protein